MVENACRKCAEHKNRDAIGTCAFCGKGFCSYCRTIVEGKMACAVCAEKWLGVPHADVKSSLEEGPVAVKAHDVISRNAAVVLLLLSSITYIPLLVYWDKGRSTFIGLLVLAIVSFGFQIALIIRNNVLIWWGCFVLWIVDMIVTTIVQFYSLDPSGALSLVVLIFFFPFAIGILVWISYRSEKLMFTSMVISVVLSAIIYIILQTALTNP
jgi:hypothetical protein